MDKDEYLNKEEYNNVEGITSEDDRMKYEEEQEGIHPSPQQLAEEEDNPNDLEAHHGEHEDEQDANQYNDENSPEDQLKSDEQLNDEEDEVYNAGIQTHFNETTNKHTVLFIREGYEPEYAEISVDIEDNILGDYDGQENDVRSPIQENDAEQYSTPQDGVLYQDNLYDDRTHLFQIANEVKKKDQSRKFVLWETNELRNHWDDKLYSTKKQVISQRKLEHHWNNNIARDNNIPFDYSNVEEQNLPIKKSQPFYDFLESKVPMLSDHDKAIARKQNKMFETGDALQSVPKKDHHLNNIFLQSHLQNSLQSSNKNLNRDHAPYSHQSLNAKEKVKSNKFDYSGGRPLFGIKPSNTHVQNVNAGRQRTFYESHVF